MAPRKTRGRTFREPNPPTLPGSPDSSPPMSTSTSASTETDGSLRESSLARVPTLATLFAQTPIQNAIIRYGQFDRHDLRQLELAGIRVGLSVEAHRRLIRREDHCECFVDFAAHPRQGQNNGAGRCPNTNISSARVEFCDGSSKHHGGPAWPHLESFRVERRWVAVDEYSGCRLHPPGNGSSEDPFLVCSECLRDSEYEYMDPSDAGLRRGITDSWVPFCKQHSLEAHAKFKEERTEEAVSQVSCQCVQTINLGWSCTAHREETLRNIQTRANHHKEWLRHLHTHRPPRPRLGPDFDKINTAKRKVRGRRRPRIYHDPLKSPKKWPGCPAPYSRSCCGKPSWNNPNAERRMARCLGCGGFQACTGRLDDLSPDLSK